MKSVDRKKYEALKKKALAEINEKLYDLLDGETVEIGDFLGGQKVLVTRQSHSHELEFSIVLSERMTRLLFQLLVRNDEWTPVAFPVYEEIV